MTDLVVVVVVVVMLNFTRRVSWDTCANGWAGGSVGMPQGSRGMVEAILVFTI